MKHGIVRLSLLVGFLLVSTPAMSETYRERHTEGLYLGIEQFVSREYDEQDQKLRSEGGQRLLFGYTEDNLGWNHPGIIYELSSHGVLGVVFYNDLKPKSVFDTREDISSKADYLGFTSEAMVGQRYGYLVGDKYLEVMGGARGDIVFKNIRQTGDDKAFVGGVQNIVGIIAPRASISISNWWRGMRQRISIGAKYPIVAGLYNVNTSVLLRPNSAVSYFGHMDLTRLLHLGRYWINFRVFAESNRIQASETNRKYSSDRSFDMVLGLRLTYVY